MPGCDVRHLEAHLPVEAGAILLGDALEVGHEHPALDLPMGALHAGVQQVNLHQVAFIYQGSSRGERQPAPRSARATWDAPETQLQTRSTMGQGYIPIPSRSGEGTGSPTLPRTPVVLPRLPSAYWEGCRCPSWAAAAQSCPSSKGCSGQRRKSPPRRTPRAAASAPAGTRCSARRGGGKAPVPRRGWGCHPLPPPPPVPTPAAAPPLPLAPTGPILRPTYRVQDVAAHLHQEGGQEVEDVQQFGQVSPPSSPGLQPPRRASHLGLAATCPQHHHVAPGQPP